MYSSVDQLAKEWVKKLNKLDRSKSNTEKFRDFCEMVYCSLAKPTEPTVEKMEAREARYMQIVETYTDKDTVRAYPELMAMIWQGVGNDLYWDVLGAIAAELGALNSEMGQFFTPMEVSRALSEMIIGDITPMIEEKGYITLGEPAAGAGGMVLAAAKVLRQKGFNPSIHMLVDAADLSQLAYHMCYIQLTMAQIPAVVRRMNSLSLERFDMALTIGARFFYEHHGHFSFDQPGRPGMAEAEPEPTEASVALTEDQPVDQEQPTAEPGPEEKFEQLSLF